MLPIEEVRVMVDPTGTLVVFSVRLNGVPRTCDPIVDIVAVGFATAGETVNVWQEDHAEAFPLESIARDLIQ